MKRALPFIIFACIGVVGCATTSKPAHEQTAASLEGTEQALVATRVQIEDTLDSLNTLMNAPPEELAEAYSEYASDVDRMAEQEVTIRESVSDLRSSGREWMGQWQTDHNAIDNDELRRISQRRQAEVKGRLTRIQDSFRQARQAYTPLVSDLEDVRTTLANDLTPGSVQMVARTGVVKRANANGAAVVRNVDAAIVEFDRLADSLPPPAE